MSDRDSFDPAALLAALDATEAAGVPVELVEQLREMVRQRTEILARQQRYLNDWARHFRGIEEAIGIPPRPIVEVADRFNRLIEETMARGVPVDA